MDVFAHDFDCLLFIYRHTLSTQGKAPKLNTRILILGSLAPSLQNFRGALIENMISRGLAVHAAAPGLCGQRHTAK